MRTEDARVILVDRHIARTAVTGSMGTGLAQALGNAKTATWPPRDQVPRTAFTISSSSRMSSGGRPLSTSSMVTS